MREDRFDAEQFVESMEDGMLDGRLTEALEALSTEELQEVERVISKSTKSPENETPAEPSILRMRRNA